MKQKDIALIVFIVCVSAVISYFVSSALFGTPSSRTQQAEKVQPIGTDFPQPDTHYFNSSAFDPAQTITIGQNSNPLPFKASTNK